MSDTPTVPDLNEIRERALRHEAHLNRDTRFYTVSDLARRWHLSPTSVRAIARDLLPYIDVGLGEVRKARRYDPADVASFEFTRGRKAG